MNILVFSGTSDGRRLSTELADRGAKVTVCVATAYGGEEQGEHDGVRVLTGRKDADGMAALLPEFSLCIDATHPYALEVSENIRAACARTGVPYRRLLRAACETEGAVVVSGAAEGDFALALYNPSSRRRADRLQRACDILLGFRSPETPCGLVRNIGREREEARILPLLELREAEVDMFTTVFVGSSTTRVIGDRLVTPRGYRT